MNGEGRAAAANATAAKDIGKEVVIALVGVLLIVLFQFVTLAIVNFEEIKKLKANPAELANRLGVQFDLYVISLTLILGWAAGKTFSGGKYLTFLLVLFPSVLIILLALPIFSFIAPEPYATWFRIWIPDVIGFGLIWVAAHTVKRT